MKIDNEMNNFLGKSIFLMDNSNTDNPSSIIFLLLL